MVSPQSNGSPTSENAITKFPSLVKIKMVEENMEPSHGEDGFTIFPHNFLRFLRHITIAN